MARTPGAAYFLPITCASPLRQLGLRECTTTACPATTGAVAARFKSVVLFRALSIAAWCGSVLISTPLPEARTHLGLSGDLFFRSILAGGGVEPIHHILSHRICPTAKDQSRPCRLHF